MGAGPWGLDSQKLKSPSTTSIPQTAAVSSLSPGGVDSTGGQRPHPVWGDLQRSGKALPKAPVQPTQVKNAPSTPHGFRGAGRRPSQHPRPQGTPPWASPHIQAPRAPCTARDQLRQRAGKGSGPGLTQGVPLPPPCPPEQECPAPTASPSHGPGSLQPREARPATGPPRSPHCCQHSSPTEENPFPCALELC